MLYSEVLDRRFGREVLKSTTNMKSMGTINGCSSFSSHTLLFCEEWFWASVNGVGCMNGYLYAVFLATAAYYFTTYLMIRFPEIIKKKD